MLANLSYIEYENNCRKKNTTQLDSFSKLLSCMNTLGLYVLTVTKGLDTVNFF